jgi:polyisoprenoid-binding protein YceI
MSDNPARKPAPLTINRQLRRWLYLAVIGLILTYPLGQLRAQDSGRTIDFSARSQISVEGTSTVHDWSCEVESFSGQVTMDRSADDPLDNVTGTSLTIPVAEMECGRNTMNRKLREAFKADDHPDLSFTAEKITVKNDESGAPSTLSVPGNLTMAGVTRSIEVSARGEQTSDGHLKFTGQHELNMTTYDMDPPTAMFGTIRTGEDVVVQFEILIPYK